MNKERLDKLLISFYDGQTTLEEEKQLMYFFASATSLDEKYLADKELFLALKENAELVDMPSSLDDRLVNWLEGESDMENMCVAPANKKHPMTLRRKYLLSLAASLFLLLCGSYILKTMQKNEQPSLVAVELNLEESTEVTEQVLLLLSSKLNQSVGVVDLAQTKVNDVSRVMHKLKVK